MTACCKNEFSLCILQHSDVSFTLVDAPTQDFSGATEITVDFWDKRPGLTGATNLLSYSLTGGEVSQPNDYTIAFTIPNADSGPLPGRKLYAEAWVTFSDGTRAGSQGWLEVTDTRKHD